MRWAILGQKYDLEAMEISTVQPDNSITIELGPLWWLLHLASSYHSIDIGSLWKFKAEKSSIGFYDFRASPHLLCYQFWSPVSINLIHPHSNIFKISPWLQNHSFLKNYKTVGSPLSAEHNSTRSFLPVGNSSAIKKLVFCLVRKFVPGRVSHNLCLDLVLSLLPRVCAPGYLCNLINANTGYRFNIHSDLLKEKSHAHKSSFAPPSPRT
jgi:hypothetical protein